MRRTLIIVTKRLETIHSKPVGISARSLYIPVLVIAAIVVKVLELWNSKDEVKQWVLTGETAN